MKTISFLWTLQIKEILADSSAQLRLPLEGWEDVQSGTISNSTIEDYIKSLHADQLSVNRGYGAEVVYDPFNSIKGLLSLVTCKTYFKRINILDNPF